MGMFDYVECEYPLPDGYTPKKNIYGENAFQTKDFERIMTTLKITAEGRLEIFLYDYVQVGEYDPGWTDGELVPRFERTNKRWVEYTDHAGEYFTGAFNFYSSLEHDYRAYFHDGQLQKIILDDHWKRRAMEYAEKAESSDRTKEAVRKTNQGIVDDGRDPATVTPIDQN